MISMICLTFAGCPRDAIKLAHRARDKMAVILTDDDFICIFLNENFWILNTISLKYVPLSLTYNTPWLVQIMGCHRTGDKPLSEPIRVQFTDAYLRHSASMSYDWGWSSPGLGWGQIRIRISIYKYKYGVFVFDQIAYGVFVFDQIA